MATFIQVVQPIRAAEPGRRILDAIYGPGALHLRRRVASILHGRELRASDRLCQYGRLRKAILEMSGVGEGTCIADANARLEEHAERVFRVLATVPVAQEE